MKRLILYSTVFTISTLTACNKYLDQKTDSTITELNSPDKIAQLLATAYPKANYITICESMSDNAGQRMTIGDVNRVNTDSYNYNVVEADEEAEDSPEMYWSKSYAAVASANEALEMCNKATDKASISAQKGEALVCRAYAHFMLVNLFSKFYNPATATTDPGIPYVLTPETKVFEKYDRKTVAYVYDMVEKDLQEGLPLINDKLYSVPRYHFNKAAACAFASRFYLYKKQYDSVLKYTAMAFPGNNIGSNLRPWNTDWSSYTYKQLWSVYAKATVKANLLIVETPSLWGRYAPSYSYGLNDDILTEVQKCSGVGGGAWPYPSFYQGDDQYFIPKLYEYFYKESVNADIGQPYVMVPLFTTEEVLFNDAEAKAYKGDNNGAIADLNIFLSNRIKNYNASTHSVTLQKIQSYYSGITDSKLAIIQTILDYRRMEFLQEGLRWFDLQRFGLTVTHTYAFDNAGLPVKKKPDLVIKADDSRRVLQLPASAQLAGLELNKR